MSNTEFVNVAFDNGEKGEGWYIDHVIHNDDNADTKNIGFARSRRKACLRAMIYSRKHCNIPIHKPKIFK